MKCYKVGGAVRDFLLNLPIKDTDWVVIGATPDDMIQKGFKPIGKDFPVFLHPKTHEEYALARTERKIALGYHGFQFYAQSDVTLEEDLIRRDLTINAMAIDPETHEIIDPFNGRQDLEKKILRHVSPAFAEDPVRILRIARFASRFNFQIADETIELMKIMVQNGEVNALVSERVWQEVSRALMEQKPSLFFETLRRCGALKILFPSLERLFGVPQTEKYHPEIDTGIHVMMVIDQASKQNFEAIVRFCALTHDLGKGTTPKDILPQHIGHESRGVPLVEQFSNSLKVPKEFKQMAQIVAKEHTHVHKIKELRPETILKLFQRMDAYRKPERIRYLAQACIADHLGRKGFEQDEYSQAEYLQAVFKASNHINKKSLLQDIEQDKIRQTIENARLDNIKQFVNDYRTQQD